MAKDHDGSGSVRICDTCNGNKRVYNDKTKKFETCGACNGKGYIDLRTV
jgi:DnaJ-class molecular chaperone